jgi:hypothetical protein
MQRIKRQPDARIDADLRLPADLREAIKADLQDLGSAPDAPCPFGIGVYSYNTAGVALLTLGCGGGYTAIWARISGTWLEVNREVFTDEELGFPCEVAPRIRGGGFTGQRLFDLLEGSAVYRDGVIPCLSDAAPVVPRVPGSGAPNDPTP